ncbi:MAG: glycosyltransferase [Desulfomonile sp.]|nr:glycosyltransferase [Desulfomonile sp.]
MNSRPKDPAAVAYGEKRRSHWNSVAQKVGPSATWGAFYHRRLEEIYRSLVLPGQRVIELGCGYGDLLAALRPAVGVGVDFSGEMVRVAAERHPDLRFIEADVHDLVLDEKFDVVILSDLVNDLWDVQSVLEKVHGLCESRSRVIINNYSRLWELPLAATQRFDLARPTLYQNWLTVQDIAGLLRLTDFEVVRNSSEILLPLDIPVLQQFCNRFLVKLWPFKHAALTNVIVARPVTPGAPNKPAPTVSVLVPARNEAGNIEEIFRRVPEMGSGVELVFVEGHSRDNTYEAIQAAIAKHPDRNAKLLRQTGEGKGDAVRLGFDHAEGDILMILDADMTVPPEDLPRFYDALVSEKGEFINGVRLVYPLEDRAMRFFNLVGNKLFSAVFSWLLGQPIKDTLCGTKVLWRDQYRRIAANRSYFGTLDPFGDFDLILGAALLNLKILDLPIRYRERRYGETNIRRWKHGALLLRMALRAAWRLKFI